MTSSNFSQLITTDSARFCPHWDQDGISQLCGLITMIEYIFDKKPDAHIWCEIGSGMGESASIMLGFSKIHKLFCIDNWSITNNYFQEFHTPANFDVDFSKMKDIFYKRLSSQISKNRCIPIYGRSDDLALTADIDSIDVVYIDAEHTFEAVKKDLNIWFNKINSGGFLCGHDYTHCWPGVIKAVNEFVESNNLNKPMIFDDTSFLIQKI